MGDDIRRGLKQLKNDFAKECDALLRQCDAMIESEDVLLKPILGIVFQHINQKIEVLT